MNRYNRHIILEDVGSEGQNKISIAKVLVIGAGGLGCPVLQYLVAAGVGTIGIIDYDNVEESNLQRQVLFGTSTLGKNKALAAKERLKDLNPTININAYPVRLTIKNVKEYFNEYDIIVDGTDNFETRYLINDAAVLTNKPVVYGAIYKFEGQVAVFNYKEGPTYRCLFPNPPKESSIPNCSEVGVLGVLPGIIGTMQANEVLKIILDFNEVLSGKLFCFNAKTSQTSTFSISKSNYKVKKLKTIESKNCNTEIKEIYIEDALQINDSQFLDVRELNELPKAELPNYIQIPLRQLSQSIHKLDKSKTIIVLCQTGIRSKTAIQQLQKQYFNNCFNLKGGIIATQNYLKEKI